MYKHLVFIILNLIHTFAYSNSCEDYFNTNKPLTGESIFGIRWSNTEEYEIEIQPGIKRIGKENIRLKYDTSGNIIAVIIKISESENHEIKVSKSRFYIMKEKITEEHISFIRLDLVPFYAIKNLKEIRFDYLKGALSGCVSCLNPRVISLNIKGEQVTSVFAHELGHVTHFHTKWFYLKWRRAIKKDNNTVSQYGNSSIVEDFAETFAIYLEPDPNLHKKYRETYPHRFAFMDEIIKGQHHTNFSSQRILVSSDPLMGGAIAFSYLLPISIISYYIISTILGF